MITNLKGKRRDLAQDGEMTDTKVTSLLNKKDFLSTLEAAIQSTNSPSLVPHGKLDNHLWANSSDSLADGPGKDKVTEADLESFAAYDRLCSSHLEEDKSSVSNYFKPQHQCHVCKGLYPTWSHLRRHLQTHTTYRPYKCDSCEKSFRNYSKLKRHLMTHTGLKPYKCPVCSKAVSRQEHLKRHLLVHSEQRPYKCSVCDYSARRIDSVKTHQRSKHTKDEVMQILFMGTVLEDSVERELNRNISAMSRNIATSDDRPKRSHKRKKPKLSVNGPESSESLQDGNIELELKKRERIASEMLGMMAGHGGVPDTNRVTEARNIDMASSGQFSHEVVLAEPSTKTVGRDALPSELTKSTDEQSQAPGGESKNQLRNLQLFTQQRVVPNDDVTNKTESNTGSFHNQQMGATRTDETEQQRVLLESEANNIHRQPHESGRSTSVGSPAQTSAAIDTSCQQTVTADINPLHHLDHSFSLALLGRQKQPSLAPNAYNAPLLHNPDGMRLKTELCQTNSQIQQRPTHLPQEHQQPNTVTAAYTGSYTGFPQFVGQAMSPQDVFIANRYLMPPENTPMAAAAAALDMHNPAFYASRQHPNLASQTVNAATGVTDILPDSVSQIPEFFRKRIRQGCEQLNKLSHSPPPVVSQENTDTDF